MTIDLIKEESGHISDPLALFYELTNGSRNNILLESMEIHTKAGTQSLLGVNSALRISCRGLQVTVQILNGNGRAAAELLKKALPAEVRLEEKADSLVITYPEVDRSLDEDSRLKSLTVIDTLRQILRLSPEISDPNDFLLAGIFGYDLIASVEKLPEVSEGVNTCPDYCFYLLDTVVSINHLKHNSVIHGVIFSSDEAENIKERVYSIKKKLDAYQEPERPAEISIKGSRVETDNSDEDFCHIVEQLKKNIFRGDIFQVVPSRSFMLPCPSPINAYHKLKHTNPSPYMFYMQDEDFIIFGASPESSVKYTSSNRQVEMYPIAGTRGRARKKDGTIDLDKDSRLELELRQDKKENAEHLMLVDLARNDIARISEPGTRYVKDLLNVDRYSHVMHLVSRVIGTLRQELDALHAYQACMNMGTLTGAPKIKASELIRQTEKTRRGSYGGAIGFLSGDGSMDTCIVIRSAFVKDGKAFVQAGCGVVYDSQPMAEADETRKKAAAVLNAIALSHGTNLQEL